MPRQQKNDTDRRKWSTAEEEEMVEQLLVEQASGNQAESGWKPVVWAACVERLDTLFPQPAGLKKERDHIKSRWQRLKKQWKIVAELRGLSGFGWDEATQTVTASDGVWKAYLAVHPEARPFREHAFPLYDKLRMLVEPVTATGNYALHLGPTAPPSLENHLAPGDIDDEDEDELDEESEPPRTRKRRAVSPQASAPKRVRASGAQGILAVAEAIKDLSEAMTTATSASLGTPLMTSPERHERAVHLVEEETTFTEDEVITAIDLFTHDSAISRTYAAIQKPNLRTRYLRKQLNTQLAQVAMQGPFTSMSSSPAPSGMDYSQYTSASPFISADLGYTSNS
ncbi:hypothetical protein CALVIDRAFT_525244 [Calocera viscosa TUFC12733]|uniref:Myb/SANT-like domain-containing protein n=1 Tax=Calocera viscosa (strain TUFC12733) TaxID=1330018 RepID=A0A167QER5_CALVF|nr:hypothetical protein CALVIDRAFT_525244 [Calocera viscosa TUFC12733]